MKHNTEDDAWTVLNGKVYDITMYMEYHPGGIEKLMLGAGKDCSLLFSTNII
jgi:cytochrome-b5 reductase